MNRYLFIIILSVAAMASCNEGTGTKKQPGITGTWTWQRIAIDSNRNGVADWHEWVKVESMHLYGAVTFNADSTGYTILTVANPDTAHFRWRMSADNKSIITTDTGVGSNPSTAIIDTLSEHYMIIKEDYNNGLIWTEMTK